MVKTAVGPLPTVSKELENLQTELQNNDDQFFEEMSAELFSRSEERRVGKECRL